jgi:hypothetical protein
MPDNRCPNCENDITETVNNTLIDMIRAGNERSQTIDCPHCGEALTVTAQVSTALLRETAGRL